MSAHTLDWGDVPTWIGAITTSLALLAAAVIVLIEVRRDNRALRARESGEQADLVAIWKDRAPRMILRNGSNLPIYAVRITLVHRMGERLRLPVMRTVPPGDHDVLYPRSIFEDNDYDHVAVDTIDEWDCEIMFVDTASRVWRRYADGNLLRWDKMAGYDIALELEAESRADAAASERVDEPPA